MATVTQSGITPRDLSSYKQLFESRFAESFGTTLNLAPETPQGQIIAIMSLAATELDESLVSVANGLSVSTAIGIQLDHLGTLLNITRKQSTISKVTATISGVAGTEIPAGFIAQTVAGDDFVVTERAFISSTGSVNVQMVAALAGSVLIDAGTLTQISSLINGVETITNALAGVVGQNAETDYNYRKRLKATTSKNASATITAIESALLSLDGVKQIRVEENATNADVELRGETISPHSIYCCVSGGTESEIVAGISNTKGLGVNTSGKITVGKIRYSVPIEKPIKIQVGIGDIDSVLFPANGLTDIQDAVVSHIDDYLIGQDVGERRISSAILSYAGYVIKTISFTLADGETAIPTAELDTLFTIIKTDVVVTIA